MQTIGSPIDTINIASIFGIIILKASNFPNGQKISTSLQNIKIIVISNDQLALSDYKIYKLKYTKNKYKEMPNPDKNEKHNFMIDTKNKHVTTVIKTILKIIK